MAAGKDRALLNLNTPGAPAAAAACAAALHYPIHDMCHAHS